MIIYSLMEIREYDSSYDLLNQHLTTKKCVYGIKRYPAIFLKNKDLMILKLKDAVWKFSDDFFKEHNCFFSEHKPIQNHYNNTNPYAINVNYQPFGTTYYHVITEVLPNALFLSEIIDNKEMPILVPESKFISNIFAWFDIKNPITFKLDGPYNFLKQQTTECGLMKRRGGRDHEIQVAEERSTTEAGVQRVEPRARSGYH